MMMRSLQQSHDVPRDSSSSCLKFRTSLRRLTTLAMGKKCKQNLEHNVSQSSYILPTVRLYHCLVLPVKENRNNFHLKVSLDMPVICTMHRSAQTLIGVSMDFRCLLPERIDPESILLNSDIAHNQVL